jgi:hypothetical protein
MGATGLASSADAGIISIDVSGLSGPNGGAPHGGSKSIPFAGATLSAWNYKMISNAYTGFHTNQGDFMGTYLVPSPVSSGGSIDGSRSFDSLAGIFSYTYYDNTVNRPAIGVGQYLGFRLEATGGYNYGWMEVTWDPTIGQFELKSAAYESTVNTAILAGDTGSAPVPEPASSAVVALLMGGTALRQWRKNRRESQNATNATLAS